MTEAEKLCERLNAIDEEAMYQAPASTHATITESAAMIAAQAAEIARLRDEVAGYLAELLDHNGDDMIDSRAMRLAALSPNGGG